MFKNSLSQKYFRSQRGFTLLNLVVSAIVIIIIFSFVLASFRTVQYSGELDVVLRQIISGITTIRNMSLGGQIITNPSPPPDEILAEGGYGIAFNLSKPSQYVLFFVPNSGGGYSPDNELPDGTKQFNQQIILQELFGLTDSGYQSDGRVEKPGEGSWADIGGNLEPVFSLSGQVLTNLPDPGDFNPPVAGNKWEYVGGKIRHIKTNKTAYFYISLISGLVTGELYDRR